MGKFGAFHINRKSIDFVKTVIPTSKDTTGCGDIFFSIYILLDMYSNLNLKEKINNLSPLLLESMQSMKEMTIKLIKIILLSLQKVICFKFF